MRTIFDNSGDIESTVDYDAFGGFLGGVPVDRYAYTGREWDDTLGLQYSRARMYDTENGRWMGEDPIGFAAGDANLGRYVGNQPTGAKDPSGMDEFKPCGSSYYFHRTYFWSALWSYDKSIYLGEAISYKGNVYIQRGSYLVRIDLVEEATHEHWKVWWNTPTKITEWFRKNNTDFTSTVRSGWVDEFGSDFLKAAATVTLQGANALLVVYSVAVPGVGGADLLVRIPEGDISEWDVAALVPLLPSAVKAGASKIYIAGKDGKGFAVPIADVQKYSNSIKTTSSWQKQQPKVMLNNEKYRKGYDDIFKPKSTTGCPPASNSKFADHVFGDASKLPCFPADTLVHTADGLRPIQSIEDGDQVLAFDERQNCVVERSVTACLRNWTQQLVKVQFGNEVVMATRTHPFYSLSDSEWVSAHRVAPGMVLLGIDLLPRTVNSVETVATEEPTYNIEVDGLHNYFVGEAGVLVHNSGFEDLTKSNIEIYVIKDASGRVVYVGQTVQGIDIRFNQHIGKGHPHWKSGYRSELAGRGIWTKFEAAVWERHFIDQHGGLSALENINTPINEANYNKFKQLHNPC